MARSMNEVSMKPFSEACEQNKIPILDVLRRYLSAQRNLLEVCCRLLAPGGRLCYSTCSILPEENEGVVCRFVEEHPGLVPLQTTLPWGRMTGIGRQLLPGEGGMDGFYYALLDKMA